MKRPTLSDKKNVELIFRRTKFSSPPKNVITFVRRKVLSKSLFLLHIMRGKALKKITYTLLIKSRKKSKQSKKSIKKSRKNQKSKKSRTPFFQVLYPSTQYVYKCISTKHLGKNLIWQNIVGQNFRHTKLYVGHNFRHFHKNFVSFVRQFFVR